MENLSLAIAFGAGFLSFASPCVLPLVPAYIAYLAGCEVSASEISPGWRITFFHALSFVLGFSVVFVALGAAAGAVGSLLSDYMPLLLKIAGVILVFLGLHLAGAFKIPFLYRERRLDYAPATGRSYLRSFTVGSIFSIAWTPCVGPILGAIFALAWSSETVWSGAYLLAFYSLGLGVPFLLTGLALGSVMRYLKRLNRYMSVISIVSGVLLIAIGIFIFTDSLTLLSPIFDFSG